MVDYESCIERVFYSENMTKLKINYSFDYF